MGQGYRNGGIMAVTLRPVVRDFLPPILARALRSLSKRHGIPSLPKDDLMLWLGFINPGMLIQGNIELFAYCLARLPSKSPVLEIGSFAGLSLNHIILLLRRARILHRCMEFRRLPVRPPHRGIVTFDDYRMHVIETFRRNVMLFSGDRLPHHIELSSDAFFAAWEVRESHVDFFGNTARLGGPCRVRLYRRRSQLRAINARFRKRRPPSASGRFHLFDDSADGSDWGSNRTAREAARLGRYEVVARNPNYCIRKR
jgi:hypothetical protein